MCFGFALLFLNQKRCPSLCPALPLCLVHLSRLASCLRQQISQEVNQESRCWSWKGSCQSQASMGFSCQIPSTQMSTVPGSHTGVVRGKAWRRMFSTLQLMGRSSATGAILLTQVGMACIANYCFPARESSCFSMKICTRDGTGSTVQALPRGRELGWAAFPLEVALRYKCLHTFIC